MRSYTALATELRTDFKTATLLLASLQFYVNL